MVELYTGGGKLLGAFDLNPQDQARLDAGAQVSIHFHTPRMLRHSMGTHNFEFNLHKKNGRIIPDDVELAMKFLQLMEGLQEKVSTAIPDGNDNNA